MTDTPRNCWNCRHLEMTNALWLGNEDGERGMSVRCDKGYWTLDPEDTKEPQARAMFATAETCPDFTDVRQTP